MESFLVSTGVVALAEIGDKTPLLSPILAAHSRKPWPTILDFEELKQQGAAATVSHSAEGKR